MAVFDVPQERWVVAERRDDGRMWPLLMVADAREAIELVKSSRARGRYVDAVAVDDEFGNVTSSPT